LGRIEKPPTERYAGKRKIYLVPLLFTSPNAPEEYARRFARYWSQAREQIRTLETGIGRVKHVYHESVAEDGEEGLKTLTTLSPSSHRIAEEKCKRGAQFDAIEDRALLEETIDWQKCLLVGLVSEKAAKTISQLYDESSRKRWERIAKRIDETLQTDEAAVLFIREGHIVQFPQDVEVFYINPPALDEIHRWFRERPVRTEEEKAPQEQTKEEG
jgi:hypothetical protein